MRNTIAFAFATDLFGAPSDARTLPWAALNNRKVTLSFKPATDADQQALLSLLPEGEITDLSQLPSSIPSYLVEVIPELKVDGAAIMQGDPMKLGEELNFAFSVTTLGEGTKHYQSPVVGGSISPSRLDEVKTRLEATKGALESQDQALIAGLTREDLLGDLFHAGTLGYFAEFLALGHIAGLQQGSHFNLAPSAGTYGYEPEVDYFFGFPRPSRPAARSWTWTGWPSSPARARENAGPVQRASRFFLFLCRSRCHECGDGRLLPSRRRMVPLTPTLRAPRTSGFVPKRKGG